MAFIGPDGKEYRDQAGLDAALARVASQQQQLAGTQTQAQAFADRDAAMAKSLQSSTTINNYGAATPQDVQAQKDLNKQYNLQEGTGLYGEGGLAKQLQPLVAPTRTQTLQPTVVTPKQPTAANPIVEVSARGATKDAQGNPVTSQYASTGQNYTAGSDTGYDLPTTSVQDYMNMSPDQQRQIQQQRTMQAGQQVESMYTPAIQQYEQDIMAQSQQKEAQRAELEKQALEKTAEYQKASDAQKAQAIAQIDAAAAARADQASTSMAFQGFGRSSKAVDVQQSIAQDKQAQIADLESKFTADVAQYKGRLLDAIDDQLKIYDENIKDIKSEKGKLEAQKMSMQGDIIKDMIKNDPTDPTNMMNAFEKMSSIKLNYAKFDREVKQDAIDNSRALLKNAVDLGFAPDFASEEEREIFEANNGIPKGKLNSIISKAVIEKNRQETKYQLQSDGQGGMYIFDPSTGKIIGKQDAWGSYAGASGGASGGGYVVGGAGEAKFNSIPSNKVYNTVFKPGSVGGQCGTYASTLSTATKVGNSWGEKRTKIDTQTPAVGSKLLVPLGVRDGSNPYGHVAVVLGFDPQTGNIQVVESNRHSDGKVSIGQYNVNDLQKKYGQDWGFASGTFKPDVANKLGAAQLGAGVGALMGGKSLASAWGAPQAGAPEGFTGGQPSEDMTGGISAPAQFDAAGTMKKFMDQASQLRAPGWTPTAAAKWAVEQTDAERKSFEASQKSRAAAAAKQVQSPMAKENTRVVNEAVNSALPLINDWSTGRGAALTMWDPGSDAYKLNSKLQTLKAQAQNQVMAAMKAASATGASGLGSLSEKEGELLQSTLGNLDIKQDAETLKQNILNVQSSLVRMNGGEAGADMSSGGTTVRVQAPDGTIYDMDAADVSDALAEGGQIVQ
jgi:chemotaxis protein histidine kinase CheA